MANEIKLDTQLQLWFETGLDDDGEATFKRKTFNLVDTEADADSLHAVGMALAGLQSYPLHQIVRNNSYNIEA